MHPDENDRTPEKKKLVQLIGSRLREARLAAGYKTAKEFSDRHGYPQATYIQHELGNRSQHKMLEQYARDLGVTVAWLTSEPDGLSPVFGSSEATVKVIGAVQAGAWQEAVQRDRSEQTDVPFIRPGAEGTTPHFALEVRGTSMNLVYPEGSILYCVSYGNGSPALKSGRRVIVHRRRTDGLTEATVKEVLFENGTVWLCPRSTDPRHQTPLEIGGDGTEEVAIIAIVIGSYMPEVL